MEEGSDKKAVIPGYESVQQFSVDGFKRVVNGVKAFQALPQPGPSWDLHKSYPEFSRSMKNARTKMIPMMVSLLKHVNIPTSDFRSKDVDEKFDFLVDCNDDLLERIGTALDEADGLFTKSEMVVMDKGLAATSLKAPGTWGKRKLNAEEGDDGVKSKNQNIANRQIKKATYRMRVTEKPQLKFRKPIDNSLSPFVPKLKEKPHSIKPLSVLPEYSAKNEEFYGHPYLVELNKWQPRDDMLTITTPQVPKNLKETPLVYVNTVKEVEKMMKELLNHSVIAVDLEHHSYRTYLGLTCLIQISSRDKDYVIDGLALRDDLSPLNEIFADPKVIKVFHGANSDVEWLQRDFGIYVVNMFDTYIAAKTLGFPQLSLQYLLGKYCEVNQNKSLQLADWRIRPLPNDMLEYARQDTHFLIYIYENLRNELIENGNQHNNLLLSVYDQSKMISLKRYEKPISNAQLAIRKTRRSMNNRQLYAFTEIYKWRDEIARDKDESLGFVLPNHMLLTITETLPKEMNGILACCDPVPQLLTTNLARIHKIVTTARELPLHQQSVQKDKVEKKVKQKNWLILVNSIHDLAPIDATETNATTDAFEDEEDLPITQSVQSSWPQAWTDPGNWCDMIATQLPKCQFGRRSNCRKTLSIGSSPAKTHSKYDEENLSTPFGRYSASKKIVDLLKDPNMQKDLDLSDPIIKSVYEAVNVIDESEIIKDIVEDTPRQELSRVLDEGDFIPFNPLTESTGSARKKRRGKKRKGEKSLLEGTYANDAGDNDIDALGLAPVEDDQAGEDESVIEVEPEPKALLKAGTEKKNSKKKGKFLNRLKNVINKRRNNPVEDSDVVDLEEESGELGVKGDAQNLEKSREGEHSPPAKRAKHFHHRKQNQHEHRGKRGFKKDDQKKNKTGIFKAFKRDTGKSITYK